VNIAVWLRRASSTVAETVQVGRLSDCLLMLVFTYVMLVFLVSLVCEIW